MNFWLEEARLAESRRDSSHEFKQQHLGDLFCAVCQKARWAHTYDGFTPARSREMTATERQLYKSNYYRHPRWDKPGTVRYRPDDETSISKTQSGPAAGGKPQTASNNVPGPQGKTKRVLRPELTMQAEPVPSRLADSHCHGLPATTPHPECRSLESSEMSG